MDSFQILGIINIVRQYANLITQGILNTLILSLLGTLIGFFLALVIGVLASIKEMDKDQQIPYLPKEIISRLSKGYIALFRGTPMIVQAMIIYYGLYDIINQISPRLWIIENPLYIGIFIISINTAAYIGEVIRGAIINLDRGQEEAARALGMSRLAILCKIILPQAIRNSIPAIGNELIINIKDSAVLSVIAVKDLFSNINKVAGATYDYVNVFIIAAIIYFVLTFAFNKLLHWVNKRTSVQFLARKTMRRREG